MKTGDNSALYSTLSNTLPKPWWEGEKVAEPYMSSVALALDRHGITDEAWTDIYNRAYEAVYQAITDKRRRQKTAPMR